MILQTGFMASLMIHDGVCLIRKQDKMSLSANKGLNKILLICQQILVAFIHLLISIWLFKWCFCFSLLNLIRSISSDRQPFMKVVIKLNWHVCIIYTGHTSCSAFFYTVLGLNQFLLFFLIKRKITQSKFCLCTQLFFFFFGKILFFELP